MPVKGDAHDREAAIIAAYRDGRKVTEIQETFQVGRTTLYHILKRNDVVPSRTRRQLDAASRDEALAGLHELIRHQDQLIAEQQATIKRLSNGAAAIKTSRRRGA